jgi:hypothetical protein
MNTQLKYFLIGFLVFWPAYAHADVHMSGLTPVAVYQGGSPFCSEAAAGESLWSTGWAVQSNPQDVYADLAHHFGIAIWPDQGISWYFSAYYPSVKINDVMDVYWGSNYDEIKDDIDKGWAVDAAWFANATLGHDLAVWGYRDDEAGNVTNWFFTNSWGDHNLMEMGVGGFYGNGDLRQVVGLVPRDDYVPSPDPIPVPVPPPNPDNHHSVPEGDAWAYVLTSMALAGLGKRYADAF